MATVYLQDFRKNMIYDPYQEPFIWQQRIAKLFHIYESILSEKLQ